MAPRNVVAPTAPGTLQPLGADADMTDAQCLAEAGVHAGKLSPCACAPRLAPPVLLLLAWPGLCFCSLPGLARAFAPRLAWPVLVHLAWPGPCFCTSPGLARAFAPRLAWPVLLLLAWPGLYFCSLPGLARAFAPCLARLYFCALPGPACALSSCLVILSAWPDAKVQTAVA